MDDARFNGTFAPAGRADVLLNNINAGSLTVVVARLIPNSLAAESRSVTFTHFTGNASREVSTVFSSGPGADSWLAFTGSRCHRVSRLHNAQIRASKYVIQTKQVGCTSGCTSVNFIMLPDDGGAPKSLKRAVCEICNDVLNVLSQLQLCVETNCQLLIYQMDACPWTGCLTTVEKRVCADQIGHFSTTHTHTHTLQGIT